MQDLPLITIITVVYNGAETLLQTINSVSDLNYPNISYMIIDGASTDDTIKIIKENQDKISYWVSEPDKGIYDAMNKGWAKADPNSFLLFLGSGDKILKLPDMASHLNADVIYGDVILGGKGTFRSTMGWRSYLGNTVHHQAMLVKKTVHPEPPFSLKFKIYADFDFNQRLMKSGVKFCKDKDFSAYALEGGVSAEVTTRETLGVVRKNYGIVVVIFASLYYKLQQINGFRKSSSRNSSL
jgi:glycosyltransferase involved in cell wall biosynthesis